MKNYIKRLYGGRIGIKRYYLGVICILAIFVTPTVLLLINGYLVLGAIAAFISSLYLTSLNTRRTHDYGQRNFLWGWSEGDVPLLLQKGDKGENKYGKAPDGSTSLLKDIFNPN